MRKLLIIAVSAFMALAAVGCGSDKSASSSTSASEPTWTVTSVQDEYDLALQRDIDNATGGMVEALDDTEGVSSVDTDCLLSDGEEGEDGTLTCHLEYDDGDSYSAKIEVDPSGTWIASEI